MQTRSHGDQAEAQDEQRSDHGDSDVGLFVLAGAEGDEGVGDAADADTIGNGVGQRHHNEGQESGNSGTDIFHVHLGEALEHQNAHIDQRGSGSAGGNKLCQGGQEQAQQEAAGSHDACQTGSAAGANACSGFHKGGAGGGAQNSACNSSHGVTGHALVHIDGVAVLVQQVCLGGSAVQGADGDKHIHQAEGDDQHDS